MATNKAVAVKANGELPAGWWNDCIEADRVRGLIRVELARHNGNANEAARRVGVSSKTVQRLKARMRS